MRSRFLKILLGVSLAFNISVLCAAGYFYTGKSGYWTSPFGVKIPRDKFLFENLSLRSDQIETMRSQAIRFRAAVDEKRQEIVLKRNDLLCLLRADIPDNNAIQSVIAGISRKQEEVESMVAAHILKEKSALDPGQQKKFLDLIRNAVTHRQPDPACPWKETTTGG